MTSAHNALSIVLQRFVKRLPFRLSLAFVLIVLLALPAQAQAPQPSASATAADSITVSWDGYSGSETHHFFVELRQGNYLVYQIQLGSWEREVTINNSHLQGYWTVQLQPNTDYTVMLAVNALRDFQYNGSTYQRYERMESSTTVRTGNGAGNSNTVPTLALSISDISANAFTVHWNSIGAGAFYVVDVYHNGVFVTNNYSEGLSLRIDWGLAPNTEYRIELMGLPQTSPNYFDWDRRSSEVASVRTSA